MDLKNQQVMHKTLGNGIIVSQDDKYITIKFASKTSKFMYPHQDTFEKFLTLVNPIVQVSVLKEAEEARIAAETIRIQEEKENQKHRIKEALTTKQTHQQPKTTSRKSTSNKSISLKIDRIPGKPMTFFVFQGSTFDIESRGGFIWAPQHNQSGGSFFHWDNLLHVKEGDIILHGCNGYIMAVSIAVSNCYDYDRPEERTFEDTWDRKGRRVDLKYTTFQNPIKTSDFTSDILEYCKVKYSPFDKDGNGNMGYLYVLNRRLACIFLRAALCNNPYLSNVDYIMKLLMEETI